MPAPRPGFMKLLWMTDPHLDFLPSQEMPRWFDSLMESEGLLIGGDLTTGRDYLQTMREILEKYPHPVTVVLGNHDFYGCDMGRHRSALEALATRYDRLTLLEPGIDAVPSRIAGSNVWLCGTGGWGDALAGVGRALAMPLNDENYIVELRNAARAYQLDECLRALGDEHARYLSTQLEAIPTDASAILILTHVPPWPGATWHEGRQSNARALPRFCWVQGGQAIDAEASKRAQTPFLVLSGHTHGGGVFREGNVTCHTGASRYRSPHRNAVLSVEADEVGIERLDGLPSGS